MESNVVDDYQPIAGHVAHIIYNMNRYDDEILEHLLIITDNLSSFIVKS